MGSGTLQGTTPPPAAPGSQAFLVVPFSVSESGVP